MIQWMKAETLESLLLQNSPICAVSGAAAYSGADCSTVLVRRRHHNFSYTIGGAPVLERRLFAPIRSKLLIGINTLLYRLQCTRKSLLKANNGKGPPKLWIFGFSNT